MKTKAKHRTVRSKKHKEAELETKYCGNSLVASLEKRLNRISFKIKSSNGVLKKHKDNKRVQKSASNLVNKGKQV